MLQACACLRSHRNARLQQHNKAAVQQPLEERCCTESAKQAHAKVAWNPRAKKPNCETNRLGAPQAAAIVSDAGVRWWG